MSGGENTYHIGQVNDFRKFAILSEIVEYSNFLAFCLQTRKLRKVSKQEPLIIYV